MILQKLKQMQMQVELLWFRRKMLISVTAVGLLLGLIVALFIIPPQYTTKNQLYFSAYTEREDKTVRDKQLENSRGLAESYVEYMKEAFMFERAAENQPNTLSKRYTAPQIRNAIRISVDSDANVIYFSVTTGNQQDSAILCDYYSHFSMAEIVKMTGVGSYEIFNRTKVPKHPSFPNPILFALVGALIALALGVAYALKIKQKIYTEREIKELIPRCNVIASVAECK